MSDSKNRQKSLPTSERRSNLLPFVKDSQAGPSEETQSAASSSACPITDGLFEPLTPEDNPFIFAQRGWKDEPCCQREAMADLRLQVEQVETADDFSQFAQDILGDLGDNWDAWMNTCLHSFIDALGHAATHLAHTGRGKYPRQPSWKLFAATLYAARFYGAGDFEDWVEEFIDGLFAEGGDSATIN